MKIAMIGRSPFTTVSAGLLLAFGLAGIATAEPGPERNKAEKSKPPEGKPQSPAQPKAALSEIQQFCINNAALMGDARIMWQTEKLQDLEAKVKSRIADLEAKRAEYADWLRKHEEALKKAQDDVVAIYAHMKPEAAASQIAAMDDAIASAILAKLSSRAASAILNEVEPGHAAKLTNSMLGPNNPPLDEKKT